MDKKRLVQNHRIKAAALIASAVLLCSFMLSSCGVMHQVFSKKVKVVFDANGGKLAGEALEKSKDSDGVTAELKCIVGDPLPDIKSEKKYYTFKGWYTEKDGGIKVAVASEDLSRLYAQYKSANKNREVEISKISVSQAGKSGDGSTGSSSKEDGSKNTTNTGSKNTVRISKDESENEIKVTFRVSEYYGQRLAFTNKKGKVLEEIAAESADEKGFAPEGTEFSAKLPNRKWMDSKVSAYYIKSFGNDHVDECKPKKFRITLGGQCDDFDQPVEGSMVWYGGAGETPANRTGVIVATDDDYVYARHESTDETEDGSVIYKWKKSDVMINLADVRTDIVYDIYNAYSSRFFPIKGKAMYVDNGGKGLARYASISKESAMHENNKTGKTTFMVPVQWDFAEKIALAQSRARDAGYTLYIVDTFRPMNSVNPVAKKVDDASLLAYGGTSAHNFGTAVDTGWQRVDENGEPIGEPYVKNLQALDKKKAVKGPHGNEREIWWQGVNKLPQEWWHYGDTLLASEYREHAKRVGALYVNTGECLSEKRSKM